MEGAKPQKTPIFHQTKLLELSSSRFSDLTLYRDIIGALQYLTITCPDIAYVVNKVCQFMHNPTDDHWVAIKQILRYLKSTPSNGLHLWLSPSHPSCAYSNAD